MDRFAEIANEFYINKNRGLVKIEPVKIDDRIISLEKNDNNAFELYEKIHTPSQVKQGIALLRKKYEEYMKVYSPQFDSLEKRLELKHFVFTDANGKKTKIKLPHYGGPTGKCSVIYETEFQIESFINKSVFICFKAVDYIAEVFVNDIFVGNHEGFFAPFEFDITDAVKSGKNTLKVIVKNDFTMSNGGDKVYAATGLGWDDSQKGWHHCPPGLGIYNSVAVEIREPQHIIDIFPRFNATDGKGEIWIDCNSTEYSPKNVKFQISVYGRNFKETVYEDIIFTPSTVAEAGMSDTLNMAAMIASGRLGKAEELKLMGGFHRFKQAMEISNPKIWTPDTPYLYTVVVKMYVDDEIKSVKQRNFGIREFSQDLKSSPKGAFLLNGKEIKLFGANTMGFEQQDVFKGDFEQLIDDILLSKLCNMNFWRVTQRPVQEEVYDYCDMLGLMIQTDLPLFGVLRINKVNEVLRQVTEMERLVRSHPCCILDSYINEPFPNASNKPHRMVNREQLMDFFDMADKFVHMENPDRVTKHVDGDYDPPSNKLQDNHCYTMWYNGHGIDTGMLNKGYWIENKPNWHCGCGEFGSEGLDNLSVMQKYYPKEWIEEPFNPRKIISSQVWNFHKFFYETPKKIEDWIEDSQEYQAFATKIMTSSFRRNEYMNTFAIHLFIDAFPSGWMKAVMDCDRNPKKAFYTYMDCLSPVFCNIRSDQFKFFDNKEIVLDTYVCNETEQTIDSVKYFVETDGKIIFSAQSKAIKGKSQGKISFMPPKVNERKKISVYMGAFSSDRLLHFAKEEYELFPYEKCNSPEFISYDEYVKHKELYDGELQNGKCLYFAPLNEGKYNIAGKNITVTRCRMSPVYTVSRDTGHKWVADLEKNDFGYLYDSHCDRLAPILYATFEADDVTPILTSMNKNDDNSYATKLACGEFAVGNGKVVICQISTQNRESNPIIVKFLNSMSKN